MERAVGSAGNAEERIDGARFGEEKDAVGFQEGSDSLEDGLRIGEVMQDAVGVNEIEFLFGLPGEEIGGDDGSLFREARGFDSATEDFSGFWAELKAGVMAGSFNHFHAHAGPAEAADFEEIAAFFLRDPFFLKLDLGLGNAALAGGLALAGAQSGPGTGHDVGGTVIGVTVFSGAIFGLADAVVKAGLLDIDREHFLGRGLHSN